MPRPSRPPAPSALHFVRLAQGSAGDWVMLPGGAGRVIWLLGQTAQAWAGWLLCLRGEAVIDLPGGEFVRLRAGEGFWVTAEWAALPTRDETVLAHFG